MSENVNVRVPVVCTRGIVVFPGHDVMIEVGRPKSINAVNEAGASYDSMVWLVCQNDIMVDNPAEGDLYTVGTIAKIKVVRKKEGFMRVTFTGMRRAKLAKLYDNKELMYADVIPLTDSYGDKSEEYALVKKVVDKLEGMAQVAAVFPPEVVQQLSLGDRKSVV